MRYSDRAEAGRALAARLGEYAGRDDVTVLGLPRGGLPVAAEVARALRAPLDVWCVRKLGVPGHEEMAMGAIASGGERVVDRATLAMVGVSEAAVDRVVGDEAFELARRERLYRGARGTPVLRRRTAILVDDGLATGATMCAAVRAVKRAGAARVVVAVPVASAEACARIAREADACLCLATPEPFFAVGAWYDDFPQLTDAEVLATLGAGSAASGAP